MRKVRLYIPFPVTNSLVLIETWIAVTKNCSLDIGVVPRGIWQRKVRASDSMAYHTIDYKLLVKVESARIVFLFQCGEREYGAVKTEY
jgi:hypothetical protein